MPSGLTATTADSLALNVGVLYVDTTTPMGITQGGLDFDPGKVYREVEFDGKRAAVAELEYVIDYNSVIKGKFIEISPAMIARLESGSTSDVVSLETTYTPKPCSELFAEGDYLSNVRLVITRGDGGLLAVHFDTARITKWKVDTKDKAEAMIDCEIKAFLSLTAAASSTDTCPYVLIDTAAA
jgi:hypothetical protein